MMTRQSFKMFLKPGFEDEYAKRHNAIWPELKALLKETGINDYSIFWDRETNILFAVQKSDRNQNSQDLDNKLIVQKWWAYMADIMETNPDNSPIKIPLEELFYLE
jgi:L-rhamnose mutarotase